MPNPKHVSTGPAPDPATVPLLRRIWSGHLESLQLPPAETSTADELSFVIDAGDVGRVRVYYRRTSYKHYRSRFWTWIIDRAEPAHG